MLLQKKTEQNNGRKTTNHHVLFQDTTAGSLGLKSKVPEAGEYSGKVLPILPYILPFGHFQK